MRTFFECSAVFDSMVLYLTAFYLLLKIYLKPINFIKILRFHCRDYANNKF